MQKSALFFLITVVCRVAYAHLPISNNALETNEVYSSSIGDKLREALEKFKEVMRKGNESLGIPVLDPLKLAHEEFDINDELFNLEGEVNNLFVKGLSDYIVQEADVKLAGWKVTLNLLFTNITGRTSYRIKGQIHKNIPVYGYGNFSFETYDFDFATQAKVKIDFQNKKVSLVSFNSTSLSLGKVKVDMSGLYGNDDLAKLVSAVISDIAPDTLVEYQEEVTKKLDQIMLEEGNKFLEKHTFDDLIPSL
ncbi:hypothetical protein QAD02_005783 [Eretmocerus hayati]|uniref:Uncharacterized protein n=1 Tax=Eretmocerus hayati TaxID=131215 RepID=A0ACC2NUL3_9HYME|nr:hypothetical protein QAD02_005783 [Eretmocerus hayati]